MSGNEVEGVFDFFHNFASRKINIGNI
jgi:hypothetical protein